MPNGQELTAAARDHNAYAIERRHRHWAVIDHAGELVCLTVYKRGAIEVVRRLSAA
jgi:hypothetical protein